MKKLFFMIVAVIGLSFTVNAQADQCKLEGGAGGYIDAYVSSSNDLNANPPNIYITTTPSVKQESDGKVLCKITYIRQSDGERETITRSLKFTKNSSYPNTVYLDSKASRIVSIEIWGAECKSVNRNDY